MPINLKVILVLLALLPGVWAQNLPPTIEVTLASRMVVVGEQTRLTVLVKNITLIDWPDSPRAAPLALTQLRKNQVRINSQIYEVFEYSVTAYQTGVFTIPPFKIRTQQGIISSKAITLKASPISTLATKGITIRPNTVPYLSGIFLEKVSPYVGETQSVEAKIYVPSRSPHHLKLANGQVIQMEKEGIAAWRFTADPRPTGILNYDGLTFRVYTYRSSLNALKEGTLSIGPGKAEPIFHTSVPLRSGLGINRQALPVEFPSTKLIVRALPQGAPEGFEGAVGNFMIEASTPTRELKLGDTITVEARVTGTGNIDQFPGPFLMDPEKNWKQFEMIAKPPGSERRSSSGTVEFSQVVRPMKNLPAMPPYRFVFFDPILEKYRTLDSPPQPLVMTGKTPSVEASDSTLDFLPLSGRGLKRFDAKNNLPIWLWQIVPALLVLFLLITALLRKLKSARLSSQPAREFEAALDEVRAKSSTQVEFYREAANFVITWRGKEGFEEIFEARDDICFRPEAPSEPVPEVVKNRILKRLQSLSPVLMTGLFFILQLSSLRAQEDDPEVARARILQEMAAAPAPEHFYNLALCEKTLDRPAKAALWAYRYQAQDGDASALLKELPGIKQEERKGLDWLSVLPRSVYRQLTFAGAWAFVILLLCLFQRRSKERPFLIRICALIFPLGFLVGGAAWFFYPEEVSFDPLHKLFVASSEEVALRSQPYLGGKILRDNIAGSLCKITAERAGWVKLELPGGVDGWTQKTFVEPILMESDSSNVSD